LVAEVENWVWTALARTSINTWSVASGEDSVHEGKGGFTEITKCYDDLCGKYKYSPQGYQSLRFEPILLVALWLPLIWILSWDGKLIKRKTQRPLELLTEFLDHLILSLRLQGAHLRRGGGVNPAIRSGTETVTAPENTVSSDGNSGQQQAETDSSDTSDFQLSPITHSSDTAGPENSVLPAHDTENLDERSIEWQSLIIWQLIYCLWYILSYTLLLLVLCICLPFDLVWGKVWPVRDNTVQ
jgi:hypothetical protein